MEGQVSDRAGVARAWNRWRGELARRAPGRLGATAGISQEGDFVAVIGYRSGEAARRDAERKEIGAWLNELGEYLEGPPHVSESCDAEVIGGDPLRAGFVQIVHAHSKDVSKLRVHWQRMADRADEIVLHHPALISAMVAWHDDDCLTQTLYFNSEQEAQVAANEAPPGLEWIFEEWLELAQEERFINLREPWITPPLPPREILDQPDASSDRAASTPVPAPSTNGHPLSRPLPPRNELLVSALKDLLQTSPTFASATVITAEGHSIVSSLPASCNREQVATLGSAALGVTKRADARLATDPVSHLFVEGLAGQVILMISDSGAHLVAVASKGSSRVEILSELQVCRDRLEAALQEDLETLRRWAHQGGREAEPRAQITTTKRQRLNDLEREVKKLSSASEILKAASACTSTSEDLLR
jgi:predicted regulator of Ras-like GTPase activity (Roadblock/LC7/MglB family)